ncbi:hypothetical protein [Bradyrhizobium sp. sBnM-33]|uniref:hypothetical protein n=1 Tax=Bradyrhizobium sp. sBnM-33 TaxID=2831780 RepID=UPI001BCC35B2|nr:hypothetical protein [Bradyrhizobium sp. sBnM-33]WOH48853.1 hypothetical protein RX328_32895 [Bradyrhizobium sp. sBnM-33]
MTGGGLDRMVLSALLDLGAAFAYRDVINTFAHGDKIDLAAIDANSSIGATCRHPTSISSLVEQLPLGSFAARLTRVSVSIYRPLLILVGHSSSDCTLMGSDRLLTFTA